MIKKERQQFVVIKLGTSLTTRNGAVDKRRFITLLKQVKLLLAKNCGVCLVISGAVTLGQKLSSHACSKSLAAGLGQAKLTSELLSLSQKKRMLLAQLLVTRSDFSYKKRRQHVRNLFEEGAAQGVVFLVNENDTIDLNSFNGNDFLASEIAKLVQATHLLLLTDVEGVYKENMELIKEFTRKDTTDLAIMTNKSVGGIQAKIKAAQNAARMGINTSIASGNSENAVRSIVLERMPLGTKFL